MVFPDAIAHVPFASSNRLPVTLFCTSEEDLAADISRLEDQERLVLTLIYFEELSVSDAAEVLGVDELDILRLHGTALVHLLALATGTKNTPRLHRLQIRTLLKSSDTQSITRVGVYTCARAAKPVSVQRRGWKKLNGFNEPSQAERTTYPPSQSRNVCCVPWKHTAQFRAHPGPSS
jgi:Sigma-70, region 4